MKQTMANIKRKTGWQPQEWYFNDINAEPPVFKESALRRFILPRHGAQNGPGGGALLRGGEQSEDAGHVCAVRYRGRPL